MTGRVGGEPEQLRDLARRFGDESAKIRQSASSINSQLSSLWWKGQSAERFRSDWESQHKPSINRTVEYLDQAAAFCRKQADDLERITR